MRAQQSSFDFDILDMGGFNAQPRVEDWQQRERLRQEREDREARERAERERQKARREREARERAEQEARDEARRRARARNTEWEDPYSVLGVAYGASKSEIRAAWARMCKTCHPDAGGSEDAIKRVNEAYSRLKGGR